MARQVTETFEIGGITVEIGPPISKDGGLVAVAQNIRNVAWFEPLVEQLLEAMSASPKRAHGFHVRAKLEAGQGGTSPGLPARPMGIRLPSAAGRGHAAGPAHPRPGVVPSARPAVKRAGTRFQAGIGNKRATPKASHRPGQAFARAYVRLVL